MSLQNVIEYILYCLASGAANSTCWFSAYQEELPKEVADLRKDGRNKYLDSSGKQIKHWKNIP